jgi:hypothetical protein
MMEVAYLDGSPLTELGPGEDPNWAPDGRRILYRGESGTDMGVYYIGAQFQRDPVPVSGRIAGSQSYGYWEPQWAPGGPGGDRSFTSPDGDWVAFYGPDFDIWITHTVVRAGSAPADVRVKVASDPANEYFPMWAPDGEHIVFSRVVDTANNLIQAVVIDPDGANPRTLESEPLVGVQLVWSPDGNWLIGSPPIDEAGLSNEILVLDAFGTEPPRRLAAPGEAGFASWQRLAP